MSVLNTNASLAENIPMAFERLELALAKQNAGPFFNGTKYSLVDAAYAPFLQRYFFLDRKCRAVVCDMSYERHAIPERDP
jgi:glutathione S-transferase